jgi:hypothetical protein
VPVVGISRKGRVTVIDYGHHQRDLSLLLVILDSVASARDHGHGGQLVTGTTFRRIEAKRKKEANEF